MRVTAPATSANLGPGFDAVGLALALPFDFAVGGENEDMLMARGSHPATIAYRAAGGAAADDELFWRSPIPPGRGLGFSGAARVAGAFAATIERGDAGADARDRAFAVASELEGHPDNAAPSAYGGLCVALGERGIRVPLAPEIARLRVWVWSPDTTTATKASRSVLPSEVSFDDAVRTAGGAATLVAALSTGALDVLRNATADVLHQPGRLLARPDSAAALAVVSEWPGVLCAWLSGSGPSVAAFASPEATPPPADRLPEGRVRVLTIADHGVRALPPSPNPDHFDRVSAARSLT